MKTPVLPPFARRTLLLSAAIVPLAAAMASAQYRVDNGSANDANNRIGSGGYNDSRVDPRLINNRVGGLAGNYLVTGNVTGGRAFRGNIGYTDPTAFRGNLGSAQLDPFVRDSTGVADIRGGYGANRTLNPQPFFGNQTVAPPPGFVRSPLQSGTYVTQGAPPILPNDTRIDYGGASRAEVTQSIIDNRQQYGNAGLAPTSGMQFDGPNFQPAVNSPLHLSEFTTLARQRQNLFGTIDSGNRSDDNQPGQQPLAGSEPPLNPFQAQTTRNPTVDPNATPEANDPRTPTAAPIDARPDADPDARPGDTGQSSTRRPVARAGALQNNAQYAQLRERLEQARGANRSQNPNGPRGPIGGPINNQPVTGGVSTGQGRVDMPIPGTEDRQPADANNNAATGTDRTATGTGTRTGTGTANGSANVTGNGTATERPAGDRPTDPTTPRSTGAAGNASAMGNNDAVPHDKLNLPRPDQPAANASTPKPAQPVKIQSLSMGVKDAKLAKALTLAEEQMRAGKFGSAIDTYERAEEMASDDPLIFVGRSIAELGGGFFRNAEVHLRQAFSADESLLYAKFDLRAMIGDERLNQLATKLGEVANNNEKDPGPLMLLAFIYYNGGMEDRAARALDMAQIRAGGKDKEVEALRRTWSFEAPSEQLNK